jgi:hypothetical protein
MSVAEQRVLAYLGEKRANLLLRKDTAIITYADDADTAGDQRPADEQPPTAPYAIFLAAQYGHSAWRSLRPAAPDGR